MMTDVILGMLTFCPPLVAMILELLSGGGLIERHHSHHDTYVISNIMSRVLVMAMVFMGLLGIMLSWLCMMEVFAADETVMLGFFASFVDVMFVMWFAMRRYLVCTYDDRMEVVPLVGRRRTVRYDEIEQLRWSSAFTLMGNRSISVIVDGKVAVQLLGTLDLEQILLRINRDDAFERVRA